MALRETRETPHLARIESGGDYLKGPSAHLGKTTHELLKATAAQPVTRRVRKYCVAARRPDPVHRFLEARPLPRDIAHTAAC